MNNAIEKLKNIFSSTIVYKNADKQKQFEALSIPAFLRDWIIMRFSDENGSVNMSEVHEYVRRTIPGRHDWESLKHKMINDGFAVTFLAKANVEIDVKHGIGLFSLPDFGFPKRKYEATIERAVMRESSDVMLKSSESWGVITLEWRIEKLESNREQGRVVMVGFKPFKPYTIDVTFFQNAREEFTTSEWINLLLSALDYNPEGYKTEKQKLTMLQRILPFVEKRLNLIELAPKGTGKSYVFSQLSKYGWIVTGGNITRAKLFYDVSKKAPGLISKNDYIAMDEIQSIRFTPENEVRTSLKGYMENGEYSIGNYRGFGDSGIVLLGNIDQEQMDINQDMFRELPLTFRESALLDRFHGFIKGWEIPRMTEDLKANGWALNTEYITEMFHELREDIRYRAVVDRIIQLPRGADTRDTKAVKRIATAYLKLLFPNATSIEKLNIDDFKKYCFEPAMEMRGTIRKQLHIMDSEYSSGMPTITCKTG